IRTSIRQQGPVSLVDVNSKYPAFLEKIARSDAFSKVTSVAPLADVSGLSEIPGFTASPSWPTLLTEPADMLSMQECIERESDPNALLQRATGMLRSGGLLF